MKITKETSYIIGLAQSDGHLAQNTRNRGRFSIELSEVDANIIHKIKKYIPYNYSVFRRKRKTNFLENFSGIGLRVYDQNFREWLNKSGVPYGKKSLTVKPPIHIKNLYTDDYVRGLWDGDGSVGYTSSNIPFLSFTTHSPHLRDFIEQYISIVLGHTKIHFTKPKRDNVFNIMVTKEDAILLSNKIYPHEAKTLSIKRKFDNAQKVKKWKRPKDMVKITWKKTKWNGDEDRYLLDNGVEKTMKKYDRTEKSVKIRLWRLTKHC